MAQLFEHYPVNQRVVSSITTQGTCVGCTSPVGDMREATTHWCLSPSLSPSFPLSLKINKQNLLKKKVLASQTNHQYTKEALDWLVQDICKQYFQERANIQNILRNSYNSKHQTHKQSYNKFWKKIQAYLFHQIHTNGQQIHEKMFNFSSYREKWKSKPQIDTTSYVRMVIIKKKTS